MLEAERHRRIANEAVERIESAETERAAVVAWLCAESSRYTGEGLEPMQAMFSCGAGMTLVNAADTIECGEHLEEKTDAQFYPRDNCGMETGTGLQFQDHQGSPERLATGDSPSGLRE
jgi:hypothetical protein